MPDADGWQAAMQALMLVAELDGPSVVQALNRHVERVFEASRRGHHSGCRKLVRDPMTDNPRGRSIGRPFDRGEVPDGVPMRPVR